MTYEKVIYDQETKAHKTFELKCKSCGKPTKSHIFDDGTVQCHKCFVEGSKR